ncbi:MAG: hypothetical protein C4536_03545 [Actinobacteria bacterium]|jgi:hypothetical protein|nr:MAG: hypothetical protein C4536_03545 [Actinomycetota bacterium]
MILILAVVLLLAGGAALAAWRIADSGAEEESQQTMVGNASFQSQLEEATSPDGGGSQAADDQAEDASSASQVDDAADDSLSGEDFSYTSPDERYVTETQRHQNFFKAVGEGRVVRLEVVSADVRPVGDPDTSYIGFTLTTLDGNTSSGTFVMKFDAGKWRIAAISQLEGDLQGGTNYQVPDSFEDVLAQEITELQPFLTKIAEGSFAYMQVYSSAFPSENETILSGVVVGKSGNSVPAEMHLRRDYGIWHLTYITNPP